MRLTTSNLLDGCSGWWLYISFHFTCVHIIFSHSDIWFSFCVCILIVCFVKLFEWEKKKHTDFCTTWFFMVFVYCLLLWLSMYVHRFCLVAVVFYINFPSPEINAFVWEDGVMRLYAAHQITKPNSKGLIQMILLSRIAFRYFFFFSGSLCVDYIDFGLLSQENGQWHIRFHN